MNDRVDSCVLGALRFIDAPTGLWCRAPLRVRATRPQGVRLIRNASGCFVVMAAPGFDTDTLAPPQRGPETPSLDVTIEVQDPSRGYLPRRCTLTLPRDPALVATDSLFVAKEVPLYPSPSARWSEGLTALRARLTVRRGGADLPPGGALIRAREHGGQRRVLGRGLCDPRGEALLLTGRVPAVNWAPDGSSVIAAGMAVDLEVLYGPGAEPDPEDRALPDPDALEARLEAGIAPEPAACTLIPSGEITLHLTVTLSP